MSKEEKMLILQMVSEGKITPEQGNDLLRAVSPVPGTSAQPSTGQKAADIWPESQSGELIAKAPGKGYPTQDQVTPDYVSGLGNMLAKVLGGAFGAGGSAGRVIRKEYKGEFPQGGALDVTIAASNGAVKVQTWDQPGFCLEAVAKLRIGAEIDADEYLKDSFSFVHDGCVISAKTETSSDFGYRSSSLGFTLTIPKDREVTLRLSSSNGRIVVENAHGNGLRAQTANGRICASGCEFQTSELDTANGRIEYDGEAQKLKATTSNGRIEVNLQGVGEWLLKSANGRIEANIKRAKDAGYEVDASSLVGAMDITGFDQVLIDESNRRSGLKRYKARTAGSGENAGTGVLNISNVAGRISVTV